MLLSLDLISAKQVYKATNYKLLISHPGETMESMRAGGQLLLLLLFRILLLYYTTLNKLNKQ